MSDKRLKDLRRFYDILDQLEINVVGERKLAECHWQMQWPQRGVYFFREPGEVSGVIRKMPFLWLVIEDDAGPDSLPLPAI